MASVAARDGGPVTVVLALERQLAAHGVRSVLLTTNADGYHATLSVPCGRPVDWDGVRVIFDRAHFPMRFKTSFGHARRIWIESRKAQAVHVHGLYLCSTVAAWAAARRRRIPLMVQPHGGFEPFHQSKSRTAKRVFDLIIGRRILDYSSAVICAAESEAAAVRALGHTRTAVIPHGVDLGRADQTGGSESRAILDRIGTNALVLFIGRLAKKKNPDLLIDAWAKAGLTGATLLVVGPDDHWSAEDLRERARSLGTDDSVLIHGALVGADKAELLRRADLFVLPSDNENFGITVAEAMVAGTACLVSAGVATSEQVLAAGAGEVVESLDVDVWADALRHLVTSPHQLAVLGERAAKYSATRFSWDASAERYAELYRRVVNENAAAQR